jgi:hypothetical protein
MTEAWNHKGKIAGLTAIEFYGNFVWLFLHVDGKNKKVKIGKENIRSEVKTIQGKPQFLFSGNLDQKSEEFM